MEEKRFFVVIVLLLLVLFSGFIYGCSHSIGEEQEQQTQQQVAQKKFPRQNFSPFMGFFMPALTSRGNGIQSLENREDFLNTGANTVAFSPEIAYFEDGSLDLKKVEFVKGKTRELVRYYKEVGLAIMLSPAPVPSNLFGEPGPVPDNIKEKVLENYNKALIDLAKLAEEENVEIFSSMNEPDYKLGQETASKWGQEILPKLREVYSGKLLWKGGLNNVIDQPKIIDFSGYDALGFTSFPVVGIDQYKGFLRANIAILRSWADQDGVPELFASEFGTYKPVKINKEHEPLSISYVFEVAGETGKVDGFFILDPPIGFGTQIKGTALEDAAREGFSKFKSK